MTNIPADLHESLQSPVSSALKRYILERCWSRTLTAVEFGRIAEKYNPYFHHYQTVCQNCSTDDVGRLTHSHLLQAFEYVKTRSFNDCETELILFLAKLNDPNLKPRDTKAFATRWILQTGKALLLLDLCEWKGTDTLKEYLEKEQFVPSSQDDAYRIAISTNLRNMQDIGGLQIRWTNLLSEHLCLEKEDTQLAVFHQASILDVLENR